jgi:Acylamino-acid-releasing enzyme, N-terminal domain
VIQLWSDEHLVSSLPTEDIHDGVYPGGFFGGVSWSTDETRVAYVAEKLSPEHKSKSYFQPVKPSEKPKTRPGREYLFREDWGEQNAKKRLVRVCVCVRVCVRACWFLTLYSECIECLCERLAWAYACVCACVLAAVRECMCMAACLRVSCSILCVCKFFSFFLSESCACTLSLSLSLSPCLPLFLCDCESFLNGGRLLHTESSVWTLCRCVVVLSGSVGF